MQGCKLSKLFLVLSICCICTTSFSQYYATLRASNTDFDFSASLLFLQPKSNNLKYAVFVSGTQPYSQSWHYQTIVPDYSPTFELSLGYTFEQSPYNLYINWLHLNTSDSSFKQASTGTNPLTVQFVAPNYDVGPAVFGIKRASSTAKFNFNGIDLNISRTFQYCPQIKARLFGGISILNIDETVTTLFNNFAGMPPSTLTYGLPADPLFYFQTQNRSQYTGAGPDLGLNVQWGDLYGFGLVGQFKGMVTAGRISITDKFTSASRRLAALGINPSNQEITTPNATQIVPGVDGKLGLFFNYTWPCLVDLFIEAGYRMAYYFNAISDVNPATLVQAGFSFVTPEFSTGTMAINSTDARDRPFNFNGPYISVKLALV